MPHKPLGLPAEYQKTPEYFDLMTRHEEDDAKNIVIEKLLKEHDVRTVLDMTCGTGSQVLFLAKRGYEVMGSDFSSALLEIARAKAKKEKIDVQFIDGDMRTLKPGKFDAVITIANAVGHLTKSGFAKAMRNINSNLKDNGIYIFDIFNLEAMTDKTVDDLAMDFERTTHDSTKIHATQSSTIDRKSGLLTSYDTRTILQKGHTTPQISKSQFTLQIYAAKELQSMLQQNGFEVLHHYGMDKSKFSNTTTLNILTVARKKLSI